MACCKGGTTRDTMSEDGTLTLADGTVINTQTGRPQGLPGLTVVPTNAEAVEEVTRVRRRLTDLPEPPKTMNVVSVVAAYYMFGLEDFEIAHAINCTTKQVENIKMTAAFDDMIDAMRQNLVDGQADDVRSMLANHARTAAHTMIQELSSANGQNRIVAAKDIMDRAGHRPADVVEHRHKVEGGLTIEYVKKGGEEERPIIDLSAEDVA